MFERRKRRMKGKPAGVPEYMITYGDVMTQLLAFFILLISVSKIENQELKLLLADFPGLGRLLGGNTLVEGPLADGGYIVDGLPSERVRQTLDRLMTQAQAIFQPAISADRVRVTRDERGLVISLASDFYFDKYSADINLEESGEDLRNAALLLRQYVEENPAVNYRVEGHTDETSLPIGSPFADEWDLSAARASSTLRFMRQFLLPADNAQVSGLGNTRPLFESGPAGNSFNRRVDIVILDEGNL